MRIESMCSTRCSINRKPTFSHVSSTFSPVHQIIRGQWNSLQFFLTFSLIFSFLSFANRANKGSGIPSGIKSNDGKLFMSFKSIFQDVRNAFDYVHMQVSSRKRTILSHPIAHCFFSNPIGIVEGANGGQHRQIHRT